MPDDPDKPEKKASEAKEGRPESKSEAAAEKAEPAANKSDESKPEAEVPKPEPSKAVPVEARSFPEDEGEGEGEGSAEPEPVAAQSIAEPDTKASAPAASSGTAGWGKPFVVLDRGWTKIEVWLCAAVLLAEISVLVGWIAVHGLSTPYAPGSPLGGVFFRMLFGAIALGLIAHLVLRTKDTKDAKRKKIHTYGVTGGVLLGLAIGPLWANVGVAYAQNLKNWLDTSSVLLLLGGLGGLVKRLTIWLALLGASLATQSGKHIHFDLGIRRLPPASRAPVVVVGALVGSLVCFGAASGFLDEIMVSHFNVNTVMPCPDNPAKMCDKPTGQKLDEVTTKIGKDLFVFGRQISLDFKMLPRVLSGTSYKDSLTGAEWNEWMRGADWKKHFPAEAVEAQEVEESAKMVPSVPFPGGPELPYELMLREANLIFPFGFLMIGLRLILRVILIFAGHVKIDPDAAHAEDDQVKHGGDASKEAA